MTAQQLKNSILQMAVCGKLVPQDPNDEPASVLLERIKAEKQELIKAGKIKKDKQSSEIFRGASRNIPYTFCEQIGKEIRDISDEIPFDIPESWEWVRLGCIGETNIGLTYNPSDKTDSTGTLVLRSSNIQNDIMDYSDVVYVSCNVPERAMIHKEDILICARNGSRYLVGKSAIVDKDGMAFGAFMAKFSCPFNQYIKLFIDSPVFRQQLDGVKTETINQITQDMLKNQLCPLPPLNEQLRIIEMYHKLLPLIEEYRKEETQLTSLNETFPELLKKSILQEAVQGKLVPQDPNDEPASVLLERIRAEKQKLIKAGKIKKDKHESIIVTRDKIPYEIVDGKERCIADEVPFEIPDNWAWTRCSTIGTIIRGNGIKRTETVDIGLPCVRYGELYTTYNISFANAVSFIPKELFDKCRYISNGDVLFTLTGENKPDIAKTVAYLGNDLVAVGGDLAYWTYHSVNPLYLSYFMSSPYAVDRKVSLATGDIIVHISGEKVGSILIPIPPLSEQHRIVSKIEELLKYCEML